MGAVDNPYVGLRPFDAEDGSRFFGRFGEAREVATCWQAARLTVLYGPSGVGKTSLLQAGVIPLLRAEGFDVTAVGRVSHGSAFPVAALPEHNPYTYALLAAWSRSESPTRLVGVTVTDYLARRRAGGGSRLDEYGDPIPTLISIDQTEELFGAAPRAHHRTAFLEDLTAALDADPDLRLLLSIREDQLAAIIPYEAALAGRSRFRVALRPFKPEAALEAVRRPVEAVRGSFESGAAERLVDDLRTVHVRGSSGEVSRISVETVEPVQLQVVCSELWRTLPLGAKVITRDHVARHADIDRVLSVYCGRVLEEVAAAHDLTVSELRSWLQRSFITELGTRATVFEGASQTAGMPNAVVKDLEDQRILRAEHRAGSRWYELQHDRLIEPIRELDEVAADAADAGPLASAAEHLRTAEMALAEGRLDQAERRAERALRACADDELGMHGDIRSFLGNVAHERGDLAAALVHYREAAQLFETMRDNQAVARLLAATGRLLLESGQLLQAVAELDGANQRLPGEPTVLTELAWAYWHLGRLSAAHSTANDALAADPRNAEALRVRGESLIDQGRAPAALADLDQVPLHRPETRAARAHALAEVGRGAEADREIVTALAEAPDNARVLYRAAQIKSVAGARDEVLEFARRALAAVDPRLPAPLRVTLDWLLAEERRRDGR